MFGKIRFGGGCEFGEREECDFGAAVVSVVEEWSPGQWTEAFFFFHLFGWDRRSVVFKAELAAVSRRLAQARPLRGNSRRKGQRRPAGSWHMSPAWRNAVCLMWQLGQALAARCSANLGQARGESRPYLPYPVSTSAGSSQRTVTCRSALLLPARSRAVSISPTPNRQTATLCPTQQTWEVAVLGQLPRLARMGYMAHGPKCRGVWVICLGSGTEVEDIDERERSQFESVQMLMFVTQDGTSCWRFRTDQAGIAVACHSTLLPGGY